MKKHVEEYNAVLISDNKANRLFCNEKSTGPQLWGSGSMEPRTIADMLRANDILANPVKVRVEVIE